LKTGTKLAALWALGLAALAPLQADAQETRQLKMGTFSAANSPWADAMDEFARLVGERTEGRLDVQIYTDGQIGDMQQLLTGMQLGTIEMAYFDVAVAAFLTGAEKIKVVITPYLFDSKEDAGRILNSELFHEIYDEVAANTGVRIFGAYGDRSPRAVQTTTGPITKPEDLEGLRMRVPGIDVYERTFETLGAQVTPLGMTEIYTALSRGIVDGQDNGIDLSLPMKFHEVAKHWSATDHVYAVTGWYIAESVWQSLGEEDQVILRESARDAGALATEKMIELEADALQILEEAGVTYTVPDRNAFREALSDLYLEFEGKAWPEGLVEEIRVLQAD
jgi:TRAP-type transport system periplasmic protein